MLDYSKTIIQVCKKEKLLMYMHRYCHNQNYDYPIESTLIFFEFYFYTNRHCDANLGTTLK
jgi:hypothetical protein